MVLRLKFVIIATRSIQDNKKFLTLRVELKDLTNVTVTKNNLSDVYKKEAANAASFFN